ncbi:MAG TPA: sugar isomerase [Streptosporangiaceae bacterium]|nr:sugar isomerase [Streptosporangiaceae bacterium]
MTGDTVARPGTYQEPGADMAAEIASQPDIWERVLAEPDAILGVLPGRTGPVVAVGCGTSYYIGDAYARRRERTGAPTRAVIASELVRLYPGETVLVLSRSGSTGDVLAVVRQYWHEARIAGIIGTPGSPLAAACHDLVMLDYADETSLVQTRFATSALTMLRRTLGEDLSGLAASARQALAMPLSPEGFTHFVFLGSSDGMSLAAEASLKCIEAAGVWAEAYAVNEYLHGPVAAADERSLVWALSPVPEPIAATIRSTGATLREPSFEPQVELVNCQRLALALARQAGRDPDRPRYLRRSVA